LIGLSPIFLEHGALPKMKAYLLSPQNRNIRRSVWIHAAWFYAEPCRVEKHVQKDKKNKPWTGLNGGKDIYHFSPPLPLIYMEIESRSNNMELKMRC
jgi:hypothetical protein